MKQKKHLAVLYLIVISIGTMFSLYIPKSEAATGETVIIPNEAIRLRILANSNTEKDQEIKREIRNRVNAEITKWVEHLTSIEEARNTIQRNLPIIEQISRDVLNEFDSNDSVNVSFKKTKFPTKLYGKFLYPAGEYESILIEIGEGKGANWWCVLFPPLCFLDFSNGTAVSEGFEEDTKEQKQQLDDQKSVYVEEKEEETEVKFFLVELFDYIISLFA